MSDNAPSSANPNAASGDPSTGETAPSRGEASAAGRGRYLPAGWGRFVLALPLVVVLILRVGDFTGDRGMVNFFTLLLGVVFVLFWLSWFLVRSDRTWGQRAKALGVLALAVGLFFALFRFERLTGEMAPVFVPRMAEVPEPAAEAPEVKVVEGIDLATETAADFARFLGPGGRQAVDGTRLDPDWDMHPPQELWRRPMGAGLSGFAVRNGFALTLEQRGGEELVTCYRVVDGEPCWHWGYPSDYRSMVAGDGPRTTPTIDGGKVFVTGTHGLVAALDGATGEPLWQLHIEQVLGQSLTEEERQTLLPYGRSGSPLVLDDLVVVPGGGSPEQGYVSLLAFDRQTGDEVWRGGDRQISCATPVLAELAGRSQILSVDEDRVAGYDPADGRVLWSHPWPGRTAANANVSQPVPIPPNRVFLSKGYGQGAALLELAPAGDAISVTELWHSARSLRTKFTNVVTHEGHVYGLSDGILECVELETGQRQWKKGRYQQGQILRVGDHLLVLSESGELVLIEASPDDANVVLGRLQAIEGKTWNNLALYGDVLLVRNGVEAAAFRLATL